MKVTPLHDRVLVRRIEEKESRTAGGIIIPDTAKEKSTEGIVIAVGSGSRDAQGNLHPLTVKVGQKILFGKWGGTEVKVNDEDMLVLKESDIIGIIED